VDPVDGQLLLFVGRAQPLTVRNRCASIDRRRHPHGGKSMKRAGILFVLAGLGACPAPAGASDCLVTMAQYQQLHLGMSEAQVVAILGCDGTGLESSDGGGTLILMWDGTQPGAAALDIKQGVDGNLVLSWNRAQHGDGIGALFQDDKLVQKIQSGLK
jgi:hypothetical protein